MSATTVPDLYKPLGPYVKIAAQFKERDPVLYYWILNYVIDQALAISNAPEGKPFVVGVLTELEAVKKANPNNESFTQGTVSQCHVEAHALRLFQHADEQDRASNFSKGVIQSFYTAGLLFDVLSFFGADALDEKMQASAQIEGQRLILRLQAARKYAKWKATYLNNCLKTGQTPQPGPPSEQQKGGDEEDELTRELLNLDVKPQPQPRTSSKATTPPANQTNFGADQPPGGYANQQPPTGGNVGWQPPNYSQFVPHNQPYGGPPQSFGGPQQPTFNAPPPPPQRPDYPPQPQFASNQPGDVGGSAEVSLEEFIEARKYTKLAASALDYEDAKTAIDFLRKAIVVLEKTNR
ncbi:Vacuolar protein sorting-associated protein VTA1-like protein [Aphelenchoides fujianensis]|nr:Vacuolar protein sorting-associated protein VTA1-like protein [Aphelenchoides fujianensis]